MKTLQFLLVAPLLLVGCPPNLGDDDDATTDDDDSSGDDDDSATPCTTGICALGVASAAADCGSLPDPDPMPPDNLLVSSPAPGQVSAIHFGWDWGCCPQIAVTAQAFVDDARIEVDFSLFDDVCDCICELDVLYTLTDVPPGTWELLVLPNGVTAGVTVQ